MKNATSSTTIAALRNMFARFGIPDQIVSDNGSQFTSNEFEQFLNSNRIRHIKSAPYHPATNGLAERFVGTLKQALKSSKASEVNLQEKLAVFLMAYCNAPHSTTSASPASLLIGRQLRTRLDLLNSTSITNAKVLNSQSKTMDYEFSPFREFSVGDTVLVRDYRSNQTDKWQNAIITDRLGPLSYRVQVPSEAMSWKRHVDQIVSGYEHNVTNVSPPDSADTIYIVLVESLNN